MSIWLKESCNCKHPFQFFRLTLIYIVENILYRLFRKLSQHCAVLYRYISLIICNIFHSIIFSIACYITAAGLQLSSLLAGASSFTFLITTWPCLKEYPYIHIHVYIYSRQVCLLIQQLFWHVQVALSTRKKTISVNACLLLRYFHTNWKYARRIVYINIYVCNNITPIKCT